MIKSDETFLTSLPAHGYTLVFLCKGKVVDKIPVLGFLVCQRTGAASNVVFHTSVYPVTSAGVMGSHSGAYVLMRPSGEIETPENGTFASLDDYSDYLRSLAAKVPANA